jgi:hypothetical protein
MYETSCIALEDQLPGTNPRARVIVAAIRIRACFKVSLLF